MAICEIIFIGRGFKIDVFAKISNLKEGFKPTFLKAKISYILTSWPKYPTSWPAIIS